MTNKQRALTWTEVVEIRRRYDDAKEYTTIRGLAEEYGISKSSMHRLIREETYKEPPEVEGAE